MRLVRTGGGILLCRVLQAAAIAAVMPLVARGLGPEGQGYYVLTFTAILFCAALLNGGLGLAASCHFALCDDEAYFATPEVHRGIWPMMIMAILFRVVPRREGLEMILLGERVGAARAAEIGLVNRAVPGEQLDAEVDALARRLADLPSDAVRLGLDAFHRQNAMEYDESLVYLQGMLSRARDSLFR